MQWCIFARRKWTKVKLLAPLFPAQCCHSVIMEKY